MEISVENQEKNIKVVIREQDREVASAVCYFEDTPKFENKKVGCIGELYTETKDYGVQLLSRCEEIFKEKDIDVILGPMNGNALEKHGVITYNKGEELFALEDVDSIMDHNEMFEELGFIESYSYMSTKGKIDNAYDSEALYIAEENLKEEGITVRRFNKEKYVEDLKKIYNITSLSFNEDPLYACIEEESFIEQYSKYIDDIQSDLILIAEKDGKEIGFIYCIPNFVEAKENKDPKTIIVKTVAVLPEYEYLAVGNVLLYKMSRIARGKNYKDWIFAFINEDGVAQKMAKRNKTEVIREYALYSKEI